MLKLALIGGGIFAASYLKRGLATKDTAGSVELRPVSLRWNKKSNFGTIHLDVGLDVVNPTGNQMILEYLFLRAGMPSGAELAVVNWYNKNIKIAPDGITRLNVPVEISSLKAGSVVWNVIKNFAKNKMIPKSMNLSGHVKVNGFRTDFNETINIIK